MTHFIVLAGCFSLTVGSAALAESVPAKDGAVAQRMIQLEKGWAEQACGGKWVATEMLAEDFHGTAPKGSRYDKPVGEPQADPNTQWSTDCRLDEADVRFYTTDVAVVYGAESKTVALPDSKHERRCLVWTDTWLRRDGHWQVIAVQDTRVDCSK